jgi:RNA polymerase sigma-70 factor, ECF subfamily
MTAAVPKRPSRVTTAYRDADHDTASERDAAAFGEFVVRHRRELRGHCFRILGSTEEADDAVQETLLHAWRWRASFAGRATFRSWLYSIATNVCLDEIDRRRRRARPRPASDWCARSVGSPEGQSEAAAPGDAEPDSVVVAKESLAQACTTVLAVLTPKQRAVLILRDVMRWSACDTSVLLGTTVVAVNSALQRARTILQTARATSDENRSPANAMSPDGRVLLKRYVDVLGRPDAAAAVELVRADIAVATNGGAAKSRVIRFHLMSTWHDRRVCEPSRRRDTMIGYRIRDDVGRLAGT